MDEAVKLVQQLQITNAENNAKLAQLIDERQKALDHQEQALKSMYLGRDTERKEFLKGLSQLTSEATFEDIFRRMETEFVASEGISPMEAPSDILGGMEAFVQPENVTEFRDAYYLGQKKLYQELYEKFLASKKGAIVSALNEGRVWF